MRRPLVAGNWKMNMDKASASQLAGDIARQAGEVEHVVGQVEDLEEYLARATRVTRLGARVTVVDLDRVVGRDRFVIEINRSKHPTAAEIAVVGNGQHLSADAILIVLEISPKVFDIVAIDGGERQHLSGLRRVAFENDVAMEVR